MILVTAALLLVAAYMGAKGKLRPNSFFGIRTNLTLSDDEAWYAVHRKSAPWMAASGAATAIGGASLILVKDGQMQVILLLAALGLARGARMGGVSCGGRLRPTAGSGGGGMA
ncbi:hypothetical protein GCM10009799_39870 [Nocardiopsis rhodophaea]|uniref:SdpI family protein n=1 Tax=Nocardiopsis rhodophaea TaxID=280238 RepID=A0ABN2TG44_9ACTN